MTFLVCDAIGTGFTTPMALSMGYGTDASTGTTTSTKGYVRPLNNQHNKCNGVIDGTISIMLLPHISHMCQLVYVHTSVSVYLSPMFNLQSAM